MATPLTELLQDYGLRHLLLTVETENLQNLKTELASLNASRIGGDLVTNVHSQILDKIDKATEREEDIQELKDYMADIIPQIIAKLRLIPNLSVVHNVEVGKGEYEVMRFSVSGNALTSERL